MNNLAKGPNDQYLDVEMPASTRKDPVAGTKA